MGPVVDLLNSAGPFAGWVVSGLLGTSALWLYATDRIITPGRHREQANNYEREIQQAKVHYEQQLEQAQTEAGAYRTDRDYWRDVALDLMSTVAATVERDQ